VVEFGEVEEGLNWVEQRDRSWKGSKGIAGRGGANLSQCEGFCLPQLEEDEAWGLCL
jgi:hypothetical protein